MRLASMSRDQLELRSADVQVRSLVNCNVGFVAQEIVGSESLSEELLRKDCRPIALLVELLLIVLSPIKLRTRVEAAEVRMTTDMVPVCVSNEHGRQGRQSRRIGLQHVVCAFCEIRARARVNADELMPILGNNKVVFREFEARERVDTAGNDFGNAPRRKSMTGGFVLGKRRRQRDRMIEARIAAATEIVLGSRFVAIIQRDFAEMEINFAQPCRMRRFVCVLNTPGEFLLCRLLLAKDTRELGAYDARDPVHDEDLAV